jgi:glycosyltransferase involved in cell wall biosynthesis
VKVSVVIPAYNESDRLAACLDAVMAQTVAPDEIIVVDNNSTDDTAAIAAAYPGVRVIRERQQGRVYARNQGFDSVHGDVIARIDADAEVPADWIDWIRRFYEVPLHQRVALTGGAHFRNMRVARFVSWTYNFFVFRLNHSLIGYPTLWGSNMALPAVLWQEVRDDVCLRNDVHEDLDLTIHLHRRGVAVRYDKNSRVQVEMRRIHTDRQALWPYLQMWPRTLRLHKYYSWVVVWVIGAAGLYLASPIPVIMEKLSRLVGKKPLTD